VTTELSPNVRVIVPKERPVPADDAALRLPVPGEETPDFAEVWARDAHWPGEGADPETGEGGFRDSLGVLDVWMAQAAARMQEPVLPAHAGDCLRCAPPAPAPDPAAHPYPAPVAEPERDPEEDAPAGRAVLDDDEPEVEPTGTPAGDAQAEAWEAFTASREGFAALAGIAEKQLAADEPADATAVIPVAEAETTAVPVVKEGEPDAS
jgi:hypothetical protein